MELSAWHNDAGQNMSKGKRYNFFILTRRSSYMARGQGLC